MCMFVLMEERAHIITLTLLLGLFFLTMSRSSIPNNTQSCAKELNLNYTLIDDCSQGTLGKQLLGESINATTAANVM